MPFARRGILRHAGSPRGDVGRAVAVAVGGDPYFASVVLLLDFAGDDATFDTTDLSNTPHTENFAGNAQLDTDLQYLSTNSLLLDGVNDYMTFPDHADWDFGTGDFTVELGVRMVNASATACLFGNYEVTAGHLLQTSSGNLNWYNVSVVLAGTHGFSDNTWHHVAISRVSGVSYMFVDGVEIDQAADTSDYSGVGNSLYLGTLPSSPASQELQGNIAAVRVTKGVGRYNTNFTPPTEFYPTS
jgi:hypothetical protein